MAYSALIRAACIILLLQSSAALAEPHPAQATRRALPTTEEVEQFYNDEHGTKPVPVDFDAPPGALCGNGQSFYWTSGNAHSEIPAPPPHSDPNYQGPDPLAAFKESPYAMPAVPRAFVRPPYPTEELPEFFTRAHTLLKDHAARVAYHQNLPKELQFLSSKAVTLDAAFLFSDAYAPQAAALRAKKVQWVLFDRAATQPSPWLEERYDTLAIRLRDGLDTPWFALRLLGARYALYEITPPSALEEWDRVKLTAFTRALLRGEHATYPKLVGTLHPCCAGKYRVILSVRVRSEEALRGRKLIRRIARGDSLEAALRLAAARVKTAYLRARESAHKEYGLVLPDDFSALIRNAELELEIFTSHAQIIDRDPSRLRWNFELGLHGLTVQGKGTLYYLEPAYALHRKRDTEREFLERLLSRSKLTEYLTDGTKRLAADRWREDRRFTLGRFSSLNWIELPIPEDGHEGDRPVVELYRGVPLVKDEEVTHAAMVRSLHLAGEWLMQNQAEDGQFRYKYYPYRKRGERWVPGGNIVRHGLNPYSLILVYEATKDPRFLQAAKRGLAFTLRFLRQDNDRCLICHRDTPARYYNAKAGSVLVTVLSLLRLAAHEPLGEYEPTLRCLAEELLYLQDKNGHFRQYDVPPEHPYYGAESTIAPGQFILALARLARHYPDPRFLEAAERAVPYYVTAWRARAARTLPNGVYLDSDRVHIVGMVPWMVMALNELHQRTKNRQYAKYAFEQQDWVEGFLFQDQRRSKYPDYVGAFFKVHAELPAVNSCQFIEGASAALELARALKLDTARREEVLRLGVRFCMQLQYRDYGSTFFIPDPNAVLGGFRYHLGATRLRNDYAYHAIAAIAQSLPLL